MADIDFALTTLATLKSELSVDPTDSSSDSMLTRMILMATDRVQAYLGRKLCYRTGLVEQYQDQDLDRYLLLKTYPVRVVTSVERLDDDGAVIEAVPVRDYELNAPMGSLFHRRGSWYDSGRTLWNDVSHPPFRSNSRPHWRITYSAGYYGPNQMGISDRDLPYDIEQAALILAKSAYLNRDQDFRLVREHLLEAANWFDDAAMDREVARLLAPYKAVKQARL
jgi:hypothetical protein